LSLSNSKSLSSSLTLLGTRESIKKGLAQLSQSPPLSLRLDRIRELIVHPTIKTKENKIKILALINSRCTCMTTAADTVQRERLLMEKMKTTMEIYNSDRT